MNKNGFSKEGLCLTNPIIFYDDVIGKMNELWPAVPVYLGLNKAFHSSIHDTLIDKLINMQSIRTVRWISKVAEQLGLRGWDQWQTWMQVFNSVCWYKYYWTPSWMTGAISQSTPSNKFTDDIKMGKVIVARDGKAAVQIILEIDWRNGPKGTSWSST